MGSYRGHHVVKTEYVETDYFDGCWGQVVALSLVDRSGKQIAYEESGPYRVRALQLVELARSLAQGMILVHGASPTNATLAEAFAAAEDWMRELG